MKLMVIIFMLTILAGKQNCALLNPVQEFIELDAWPHQTSFIC